MPVICVATCLASEMDIDELRVARHLEALDQIRLETVGPPHLEHGAIRDTQLGGQLARAPVSGPLRLRLRRQAYDLCRIDGAACGRYAAGLPGWPRFDAACGLSTAPARRLNPADIQLRCIMLSVKGILLWQRQSLLTPLIRKHGTGLS